MYKVFLTISALALCAMLSACNASFVDPVTHVITDTPKIDSNKLKWYYFQHGKSSIEITGLATIDPSYYLPSNAQVIVAWEVPNTLADPKYYIYNGNMSFSKPNYNFDVIFSDSLPKNILRAYGLSDTVAVGHIFLTTNMSLKNGDSIVASNWHSAEIVGSCQDYSGGGGGLSFEDQAIVFKIGSAILGQVQIDPAKLSDGFSLITGERHDENDRKFNALLKNQFLNTFIHVTDSDETLKENLYWLP